MKNTKATKPAALSSVAAQATKAVKATTPVKSTLSVAPVRPAAPATAAPAIPAKAVTPAIKVVATEQRVQIAKAKTVPATIDVKLDVGFGNTLYMRGQGAGLAWDRGIPLTCVDGKTWRWSQELQNPITFKVLINDSVWSNGADLTVAPGQRLEIAPSFER